MMRMRTTTTVTTLDTTMETRAASKLRARFVLLACLLGGLAPACHAGVHASTAGDANASAKADEPEMTVTETEAAPASTTQATQATAPAAPAAPPPDACPLHCYAAWGAYRTDVTSGELSQLSSALEPALSKMRACAGSEAAPTWRRRGSPVLQLRVEPDGMVHEIDVDPHHAYAYASSCIDEAARETSISLAMPGRKTVRCNERCEAAPRASRGRRR